MGDPTRIQLSVAPVGYLSVLGLLLDVVAGINRGTPGDWSSIIKREVTESGRGAVRPIGDPGVGIVPDCVIPPAMLQDPEFAVTQERIRATDVDGVADDLAAEFGATVSTVWRDAFDDPTRWIEAFSGVVGDVGQATARLLAQAQPLIDREMERAGLASVRGGIPAFLGSLNSRIRFRGDRLEFDHESPGTYDLAGRRLVVVPIVSGDRMLMSHLNGPDLVWIAYPVPGLGSIGRAMAPARTDKLAALLGPPRALVLRRLDVPQTMGQLAAAVACTATRLSDYCGRLEDAGLIQRVRTGRTVRVSRTNLGEQLIGLYQHQT